MNLRQLEIISAGAAAPVLWVLIAGILYPIPREFFGLGFASTMIAAPFVGWTVSRALTGAPRFSSFANALIVSLSFVAPLVLFIWGRAVRGDDAQVTRGVVPANGPVAVKDAGEEPMPEHLLAGKAEDWIAGFKKAAGLPKTPPVDHGVAQPGIAFTKKDDGSGGATITFKVPEGNFIRTGLRFRQGEAFYISTPHAVSNLQIGIVKHVVGHEQVTWMPVPAHELWSTHEPFRLRLESAPEAELCLGAAAVPRGTYTVYVRKSSGPVAPFDYTPGVPLARVY